MAPDARVWEQWHLQVHLHFEAPTLWRPGSRRDEVNDPASRGMGPLTRGGRIEGGPQGVGSIGISQGSSPIVGLPFKVRAS